MDPDSHDPIAWRPSLGIKSLLFGLLTGVGLAVLSQQLGWIPFETTTLILWLVAGIFLGAVLASAGYAIGVARVNRALERAEDEDRRPATGASQQAQAGGTDSTDESATAEAQG